MLPEEIATALLSGVFPRGERCVERIETHRAWVFLTERHAYKLRKFAGNGPLAERLEARWRAHQNELALNLRLAETVYLGVVPVILAAGGLSVGGTGQVVDWLIEMRRLPRELMLDVRIARGTLQRSEVDAIAATLTCFYARCEHVPCDGRAYRERLLADLEAKCLSLEMPQYGLDRAVIRALVTRQRAWIQVNAKLLDTRAATLVDAHGDLRPEHICLEPQPVVIDCLEFDRQLRLLDPVSELAFLALECRRLGAMWIGERLFSRYAAGTGDSVPAALIDFYQGVHALIRAAVAIWHLDDDPRDAARWRARAGHYLWLATTNPPDDVVSTVEPSTESAAQP